MSHGFHSECRWYVFTTHERSSIDVAVNEDAAKEFTILSQGSAWKVLSTCMLEPCTVAPSHQHEGGPSPDKGQRERGRQGDRREGRRVGAWVGSAETRALKTTSLLALGSNVTHGCDLAKSSS